MVRLSAAAAVVLLSIAGQSSTGLEPSAQAIRDRANTADLARLSALQDAVANVWQLMPLTQRRAIFVTTAPDGYGSYDERSSNSFHADEKIITYVEPIGYTWRANQDGTFSYGLTVDFRLKRTDGKIVGGQDGFLNISKTGHRRNQELLLLVSPPLRGTEPGNYVIEYKLHDQYSDKTSQFTQNLTILR
jgi:hypothetical protein